MLKTGNKIVDEMAQISLTGDIIPPVWFKRIQKSEGRADLLAINILANLCYWYRPTIIRDEQTDMITECKKKFKEEYLQKQYQDYSDHFGCPKSSVKASMDLLEELGLIKRHFKDINLENGVILNNRMFIEIIPERIKEITFNETDSEENTTLPQKIRGDSPKKHKESPPKNCEYTKNTTKNTTEITTTTSESFVVADKVRLIFDTLNLPLSDSDIMAILKAANGDLSLCRDAVRYINGYKGAIGNVVGLIISFIRDGGYTTISKMQKSTSVTTEYTKQNYNIRYLEWLSNHADEDPEIWIKSVEELLGYPLSESQRNNIPEIHRLIEMKFKPKSKMKIAI
ncbi:MAG: hypothetical protein IJH82_01295 [Lachnospiraceae bacterium]|nr:hypothetical protein [Lachnospiraceae bacterium]